MKKGSAGYVYFDARNTEGMRISGLTITCVTSLDGGSPVSGPTVYEVGTTGVYYVALTSAMTNGSCLAIIPSATDVVIPTIQIDLEDYATPSEVASASSQAKVLGLLGNWTVSGSTMTTYSGNSQLASYSLTKDSGDNIVGIQED